MSRCDDLRRRTRTTARSSAQSRTSAAVAGSIVLVLAAHGCKASLEAPADSTARIESPRSTPELAELRGVDRALVAMAEHARAATVCLLFAGSTPPGGMGSGVLVSQEGDTALVLTCGHVARAKGRTCGVILSDGLFLEGEVVASVERTGIDLGLVRCSARGQSLPTIPISTEAPRIGDWVMVLGHPRGIWAAESEGVGEDSGAAPGSGTGANLPRWDTSVARRRPDDGGPALDTRLRPPVVRTGRVWEQPGAGIGVRFDAPIDAGDSGGPVIDLQGRLVAIASRCGWKSHWNWGSSVASLQGDARVLESDSIEWPAKAQEPGAGSGDPRAPDHSRAHPKFLAALRSSATMVAGRSVIVVESEGGPRSIAVAVDSAGSLVTKGSEAGFRESLEVVVDGRRFPARRIAYDPDADLLLLRADELQLPPLPISSQGAPLEAGTQLLSVGPEGDVLAVGGCSLEIFRTEEADARPFLGVSSRAGTEGAATLRSVTPGMPADRAGLQVGDMVRTVGDNPLTGARTLPETIALQRVGDRATVEFERDGRQCATKVLLARRPQSMRSRDRGNTRIAVTPVLPYRVSVFQHDGAIEPHECGSPVVDLEGRVVGINLARFDRTAVWAMPVEEFSRRVRDLLQGPAEDEARFAAHADALQLIAERQGRLRFPAEDARTVGARDLRRRIGELRATDGSGISIHSDDRLAWEFELERPGRFEAIYFGRNNGDQVIRIGIDGAMHDVDLAMGEYDIGGSLGEISIDSAGRHRLTFEWSAVQDDLPGNLSRVELRRVEPAP